MSKKNRYLEAFKENYNTVGLATAAGLSLAMLNPLPLLAGVVAEAAYLLVVPDTKWYEARLAKRFDAEVEARRQQQKAEILPKLRPDVRERFARLEATRQQIDTQSQPDKAWFREVLRKLDYLLEKFLVFAAKEAEFRAYLQNLHAEIHGERKAPKQSEFDLEIPRPDARRGNRRERDIARRPLRLVDASEVNANASGMGDHWAQATVEEVQAHYAHERENLEQQLQAEQDEDTKAILEKRRDVLLRRQEFAGKIGKILTNLDHQLQLVEDTFGLINDEIRARSPEQILADVEEVVLATNTMATALEELAPLEQMAARVSG